MTMLKGKSEELQRSIPKNDLEKNRRRLKPLLLEKELVSGALTRLYEAEAAHEITREETETLASKYRQQLKLLDAQIVEIDAFVEIGDLETLREQLVELVAQKIDAIEKRIRRTKPIAAPLISELESRNAKLPIKSIAAEKPLREAQRKSQVPDISDLIAKESPEFPKTRIVEKHPESNPMDLVEPIKAGEPELALETPSTSEPDQIAATTSDTSMQRESRKKSFRTGPKNSEGNDEVEEIQKELLEALDRLEKLDVEA